MARSALAIGQSLMGRFVFASGAALAAMAFGAPASAATAAATTSDSFRVSPEDLEASKTALGVADPEFRALNNAWGQSDGAASKIAISIPSSNPVEAMRFSSNYGPRRAPMRGASRNHKGIDIPGPVGTPIYATADGIVGRAEWVNGYGKFIQLEHGNAIETRYGHMSALNVSAGQHVRQGEIIGFMGSTGRSTGSHLHYEVRIGGDPVNPVSFLAPVKVEAPAAPVLVIAAPANELPAAADAAKAVAVGTSN